MTAPSDRTTVAALRSEAVASLSEAGIDSAALDADVLLGYVLSKERPFLLAHSGDPVGYSDVRRFQGLIRRRMKREPVAYITGYKEFYGSDFAVNRHVLIPRPKTEDMVERAKEVLEHWNTRETLVIDVGTGSGILAITVKRLFPSVTVLAIDHSKRALSVARRNAVRHGFEPTDFGSWLVDLRRPVIHFLHSDLLSKVGDFPFRNVLILANLPYVPRSEITTLERDVKGYEPGKALDGGEDGLDLFRRLAKQIRRKFTGKQVRVLWECDEEQEMGVTTLFSDFG